MKNHSIKILCPPKSCGKCKRLIHKIEKMLLETGLSAEIIIVKDVSEVQKYPTWVLPSVVINENVISRGYAPDIALFRKCLMSE